MDIGHQAHDELGAARETSLRTTTYMYALTPSFVFTCRALSITHKELLVSAVCQTLSGTHLTTLVLRITCAKACLNAGRLPPPSLPLTPAPTLLPPSSSPLSCSSSSHPLPSLLLFLFLTLLCVHNASFSRIYLRRSVVPLPPLGRTLASSPGRLPLHCLRSSFVPVHVHVPASSTLTLCFQWRAHVIAFHPHRSAPIPFALAIVIISFHRSFAACPPRARPRCECEWDDPVTLLSRHCACCGFR